MLDKVKFDQGWIGTLGYLYLVNQADIQTRFKILLKNCSNITFEDTDEAELNKTYNVNLSAKGDSMLLFRHTDCLKSVSIG
jgi:hypothetical protein